MNSNNAVTCIEDDPRFKKGFILFNSAQWYLSHDLFEELWHETNGPERTTIQAILQIAVAELHLESGNTNGAKILFGEGLGRLRRYDVPQLGLDIERLCGIVECRLKKLQEGENPKDCDPPYLYTIS